jgi:ribosome maturation factor RimP
LAPATPLARFRKEARHGGRGFPVGPWAHFLFVHAETIVKREELMQLLSPTVAALGLECLGIEFSPQHGHSLLRLFIDAPGRAITLDDCEAVSREVSAVLDVNDPIAGRYTLEVSSPGLDRPLFTPTQFERFIGQAVKVQVNVPVGGRRRFQGPIRAVDDERVVIEQDGAAVAIAHDNVLKANLVPDLAGHQPKPRPGKGKVRKH